MFPYFGRKLKHLNLYPAPSYSLVIEPFAGSMGYSLGHQPAKALGVEKDPRVVELWNAILSQDWRPLRPVLGARTSDLYAMLLSFSEHSLTSSYLTVTSRMLRDWDYQVARSREMAKYALKSVSYIHGSYDSLPKLEATWFIDPPYQKANKRGYNFGAASVDFKLLAEWCKSLPGQVIVCEQEGADWLPFEPLYDLKTHRGSSSKEVVCLINNFTRRPNERP